MNKIFTTVCALMFSVQFNLLSAQTTVMNVWQNGSVTTYKTTDVDSVTFETYSWSEKYPVTFSLKPALMTRAAAQTVSGDAAKSTTSSSCGVRKLRLMPQQRMQISYLRTIVCSM